MVSEKQKYVSGISRNIGFGLLVPLSSIIFQWIVFRKSLFFGHSLTAVILFTIAWLFVAIGYIILGEKK